MSIGSRSQVQSPAILRKNTGAANVGNSHGTTLEDELLGKFVSVHRYGAVGDGDGAGGGTDDSAAIQLALDDMRDNGVSISFDRGKIYRVDNPLTLIRTSISHKTEFIINGHGATLDFSNQSSGDALTLGASSNALINEIGFWEVSNLYLQGNESASLQAHNPAHDPVGTLTGLTLKNLQRVTLNNIFGRKFKRGLYTENVFPLTTNNCGFRDCWEGLFIEETSNDQIHNNLALNQSRYCVVVKSTHAIDDGKVYNVVFNTVWMETCVQAVTLDPGDTASLPVYRQFIFNNPYIAGITYDIFRFGVAYDFDNPQTRGADRVGQIYDCKVYRGKWPGVYSSTSAAFVFPSNGSVRNFQAEVPVEISGDSLINAPYAGRIKYFTNEDGSGIRQIDEHHFDKDGNIQRRELTNGTNFYGLKDDVDQDGVVGVEISHNGYVSAYRAGNESARFGRSDDGAVLKFQHGATPNSAGSIDVRSDQIHVSSGSAKLLFNSTDITIIPTVPMGLAQSDVASLPAASGYTGAMVYVTDEAGGAVPAFSDGTNWRRVTDRAVVS